MNAHAHWLLEHADPSDAAAVAKAIQAALKSGLAAQAVPIGEAGTARHPHDPRLWHLLGLAYRGAEDLQQAIEGLDRAAVLAPADPAIAHAAARSRLEAGLPAIDAFEHAHALAPDDGGIRQGLAAALFAEGRLDDAIRMLEAQLGAEPGWMEGHATLARLRWMRGERDSFVASYETALVRDPGNLALWRALVETLMHAELYEPALAAVGRARAGMGDHPMLDALETVSLAEKGETDAADGAFARLGPIEHVTMATRYMRHLLRAGRPVEAAAFAEPWIARDPGHLLVPYLSAAWRLTGDRRWAWLEGDPRFVGVYDIGDRLPSLDALAVRLRGLHLALHHPLEQSLRGGTQTDGPLFSRIEPEIRALRDIIVETVERHVAQLPSPRPGHPLLIARRAPIGFAGSWSVRLTGEGFHINHVHPAGWISSAFYVALPDGLGGDEHAGWLTLGEATELGLELPPIRLIEPKPGRLVLFPSTMWHGTRPFPAGERLTVAFDVARPPQ
ncbi:putative 2OG-Fe(II) oxygenase [Sphingosinicella terrae]|uniref:putative 2OG-Fe(II) oxygenase n=1 Tax=Sphingosinicella terrae TaxID=2172047 RepID=UPI000E0D89C9|nr:putative 2OG-Fe(II) oxygenase [Sphingosinicella terrae]